MAAADPSERSAGRSPRRRRAVRRRRRLAALVLALLVIAGSGSLAWWVTRPADAGTVTPPRSTPRAAAGTRARRARRCAGGQASAPARRAPRGDAAVRDPGPGRGLAARRWGRAARRPGIDRPLARCRGDRPAWREPRLRPPAPCAARRPGRPARLARVRVRGRRRDPPARRHHGGRSRDGRGHGGRIAAGGELGQLRDLAARHGLRRRRVHGHALARHHRRLASGRQRRASSPTSRPPCATPP